MIRSDLADARIIGFRFLVCVRTAVVPRSCQADPATRLYERKIAAICQS